MSSNDVNFFALLNDRKLSSCSQAQLFKACCKWEKWLWISKRLSTDIFQKNILLATPFSLLENRTQFFEGLKISARLKMKFVWRNTGILKNPCISYCLSFFFLLRKPEQNEETSLVDTKRGNEHHSMFNEILHSYVLPLTFTKHLPWLEAWFVNILFTILFILTQIAVTYPFWICMEKLWKLFQIQNIFLVSFIRIILEAIVQRSSVEFLFLNISSRFR